MSLLIYADESGDLGWSFDQPYGQGGSSRYLTIAALHVPLGLEHFPERTVRGLYKRFGWNPKQEKKWVDMPQVARDAFASAATALSLKHTQIRYTAIIVKKEKVQPHIRLDPNKLYNYMIKLLLLDDMSKQQHVTFLPDRRSLKVGSGNSLQDYLQTELWCQLDVSTQLETNPQDSAHCLNIQFADMLAGAIQSCHERGSRGPWNQLQHCTNLKHLFF